MADGTEALTFPGQNSGAQHSPTRDTTWTRAVGHSIHTELQDLVNRILGSDRTRRVDKGTQQGKDLIHLTNTHTHITSSCQAKIKELV